MRKGGKSEPPPGHREKAGCVRLAPTRSATSSQPRTASARDDTAATQDEPFGFPEFVRTIIESDARFIRVDQGHWTPELHFRWSFRRSFRHGGQSGAEDLERLAEAAPSERSAAPESTRHDGGWLVHPFTGRGPGPPHRRVCPDGEVERNQRVAAARVDAQVGKGARLLRVAQVVVFAV
jgi:hypothetical protein